MQGVILANFPSTVNNSVNQAFMSGKHFIIKKLVYIEVILLFLFISLESTMVELGYSTSKLSFTALCLNYFISFYVKY